MWGTLGGFTHRQGGLLQTTSAGLEGGGMFNDMVHWSIVSFVLIYSVIIMSATFGGLIPAPYNIKLCIFFFWF